MLIRNQIDALYGGVNQQSAEQRLSTQVEEMENAFPTLDRGLLKRNPTEAIATSQTINFSNNAFQYSYDRGDVDVEDENYSIQITSTGIEVIDVVNGNVFNETSGLTYVGASKSYITTNFGGKTGYSCITIKDTTFIVNKNIKPQMLSTTYSISTTKLNAYIWIKSADPQYGYTYSYSIENSGGVKTGSVTDTNTTAVVDKLVTAINAGAGGFTASAIGSVIKVVSTSAITNFTITDSFGNQASRGFIDEVSTIADLPATLGFNDTAIKILGTASALAPYYVRYDNGVWKEAMSGGVKYLIDKATMPHILVRKVDGTFELKQYGEWKDRTVGDDDVSPLASIFTDDNVIKDIFFLKNRLGFITESTVVLSEVAVYGNFFRTTVLSYIDSDMIDIAINTTKTISLEYAVNMEDSLMITSDKLQFRLKAVDVLTYSTIAFIQASAYDINKNIRPLFMNNRVYFVVQRGDYSAVIEFYISSQTNTIAGDDITAHIQQYIPNDVDVIYGSSVNNMLFVGKSTSNALYVYKYYDSAKDRVQSAWFKWTFNGLIYSSFSIGRSVFILIQRNSAQSALDWILATGFWDNTNEWDNDGLWNFSNADIAKVNQVEKLDIFPQSHKGTFLDNSDTIIPVNVLLGEWVVSQGGNKDIGSIVKFKTVQIESEPDSSFSLYIKDVNRDTLRKVAEKYTIKRKPLVFGDAKNIKIGIENNTEFGFRINALAYEGNVNSRSRRI